MAAPRHNPLPVSLLGVGVLAAGAALALGTMALFGGSSSGSSAADIAKAYPGAAPVADRLVSFAAKIGVKPQWIANVINFESKWNPAATNTSSGATGLIQFYPGTTDVSLGTTVNALRGMSVAQQWPYVEAYFSRYASKMKSQLDVFMAVYEPKAIGLGGSYAFDPRTWAGNPGIKTAQDYYNKAMGLAKLAP